MHKSKRRDLEEAGWKFGTADEFLGLSAEESAYLDPRERLGALLTRLRKERGNTEAQFAKALGISALQLKKLETGDPTPSLELLVRVLLKRGASMKELGKAVSHPKQRAA